MTWFVLSLIAILFWSGSDLFSKMGSKPDDKYSHWKMVMAVGAVMGLHAIIMLALGTPFHPRDIITYMPASAMYILSMVLGYVGLRYIELSISSPICNSSGAVAALLCFLFLGQRMTGLQLFGVVLVCAAVQLVRYFAVERGIFQSQLTLISGIICLGLGAFLILRSDIVVRILPIVFGLFVIFDSLGRIQNALDLRRCEYPSWKGFLLLPVLSVVLGVVMILNPFGTMETLVMAIGIILIIEGAINLLSALYTVLAIRRFAKLHPETQSMLESLTGQDLNGDGVIAPDIAPADVEASAVELDHVDESAEVEQEED